MFNNFSKPEIVVRVTPKREVNSKLGPFLILNFYYTATVEPQPCRVMVS